MLKEWFTTLPVYNRNDGGSFQALIDDCQRESLTGLLRLEISSGEVFLLTFLNGEGINLFAYENENWIWLPKVQWMSKIEGSYVDIRKANLPVQGMRACEVILTADVEQKISMKVYGTDLLRQLQAWYDGPEPGFVHLTAEGQEIFGLIFGDGASNMEVLSFIDDNAVFSVEQPDDLPVKADGEYQVRLYVGDTQQDIWLENRLRLAFAVLARIMIHRFGYMVGFILAERLCARLTEAIRAQRLNIKLSSNGVENGQLFYSLQEASEAYSFILNSFLGEASVLIGPRMSKEIAVQTLNKMTLAQRDLLVSNLQELRGPQVNIRSTRRE